MLHEGLTLAGIAQFIVFVLLPMLVSPLYVVIVNVTETLVPVVFWLARDIGGVYEILVLLDLVHSVVLAVPHLATMVCVKLVEYCVTVSVCAVPSVPLLAVRVEALGIVVSFTSPMLHINGVPLG